MHRGTCKQCGAAFWETYKGARGEDLCDTHLGPSVEEIVRTTTEGHMRKTATKTFEDAMEAAVRFGYKMAKKGLSEAETVRDWREL